MFEALDSIPGPKLCTHCVILKELTVNFFCACAIDCVNPMNQEKKKAKKKKNYLSMHTEIRKLVDLKL